MVECPLSVGQLRPNASGIRGRSSVTHDHGNDMENPHSERQAVLLERIVKNAVSVTSYHEIIMAILMPSGQMHGTHSRTEPLC